MLYPYVAIDLFLFVSISFCIIYYIKKSSICVAWNIIRIYRFLYCNQATLHANKPINRLLIIFPMYRNFYFFLIQLWNLTPSYRSRIYSRSLHATSMKLTKGNTSTCDYKKIFLIFIDDTLFRTKKPSIADTYPEAIRAKSITFIYDNCIYYKVYIMYCCECLA